MTDYILGIGISGLKAAQAHLSVASHNIANAYTEGFHRQSALTGTQVAQELGSGFFGRGVEVQTVVRAYSQFLDKAVLSTQTQQKYLDSYHTQISQLDNMLADPTSGLSPALQGFFSGVQDVATNPASVPSRQQMISLGEVLTARFNAFHNRFEEIRSGVNAEITTAANDINNYTGQIAKLNEQIIRQQGDGTRPPNDLLDQREQLLSKINDLVRTSVVYENNGSMNVFIGNGQPLIVGGVPFTIQAQPKPEDPENLGLSLTVSGTQTRIPEDSLEGGKLTSLFNFRDNALNAVQNQVGRIGVILASTFNTQHRLGQDLKGNLGGDFFRQPGANIVANQNNTGNAAFGVTYANVGALTTSDYQLRYNGSNYVLTRLSDSTQTTFTTFPQTVDGFTLNLASGTIATGDNFLIQPTRMGGRDIAVKIADTNNVAAAAPIRGSAVLTNTGSAAITPGVAVDTTNAAFATPGALTPPILIQFTSATTYSIYNNTVPGAPVLIEAGIAYNPNTNNAVFPTPGGRDYGYRINLSGAAATGDSFKVDYNAGGVADNRNALLLSGLQTTKTMANGTITYQSGYSQMVADVGNRARDIQIQSKAQDALVKQTVASQQALSGVNLDEEAANLIRFEQHYQAASRVIQVANRLFDNVLQAIR